MEKKPLNQRENLFFFLPFLKLSEVTRRRVLVVITINVVVVVVSISESKEKLTARIDVSVCVCIGRRAISLSGECITTGREKRREERTGGPFLTRLLMIYANSYRILTHAHGYVQRDNKRAAVAHIPLLLPSFFSFSFLSSLGKGEHLGRCFPFSTHSFPLRAHHLMCFSLRISSLSSPL